MAVARGSHFPKIGMPAVEATLGQLGPALAAELGSSLLCGIIATLDDFFSRPQRGADFGF